MYVCIYIYTWIWCWRYLWHLVTMMRRNYILIVGGVVSSPSAVRSVSVTVGHNSQCAKHRQCASAPDLLLHLAHHDPYERWYCFAWQLNLQHLQQSQKVLKNGAVSSSFQVHNSLNTSGLIPSGAPEPMAHGWIYVCLSNKIGKPPKKQWLIKKNSGLMMTLSLKLHLIFRIYRSTDLPIYASAAITPTTIKTSSPVLQPGSQDSCPQSIARISAPHHTGVGVASVARMGSRSRACHFATWLQLLCVWLFWFQKLRSDRGKWWFDRKCLQSHSNNVT